MSSVVISDRKFRDVPTRLVSRYTNSLPGASAAKQRQLAVFMASKTPQYARPSRRYPTFAQLYLDASRDPLYLDRIQPSDAVGPWLAPQPYSYPEVLYSDSMRHADGYARRAENGFVAATGSVVPSALFDAGLPQWRKLEVYDRVANEAGSNGGSAYMSYQNSWGTPRWESVC